MSSRSSTASTCASADASTSLTRGLPATSPGAHPGHALQPETLRSGRACRGCASPREREGPFVVPEGEHLMSPGVTQNVRVDRLKACFEAPSTQYLREPRVGEWTACTEPVVGASRRGAAPGPLVAGERGGGLRPERDLPDAVAFPDDREDRGFEVHVVEGHPDGLGSVGARSPGASEDQRPVSAGIELAPVTSLQQEPLVLELEDRDGCVLDRGRVHVLHGRRRDLALFQEPLPELL